MLIQNVTENAGRSLPDTYQGFTVDKEKHEIIPGYFTYTSTIKKVNSDLKNEYPLNPTTSVPIWKLPINFAKDVFKTVTSFIRNFIKIFGNCFGCKSDDITKTSQN